MEKKLYLIAELDERTQLICKKIEEKLEVDGLTGTQTKGIPFHITLASFPVDQLQKLTLLLQSLDLKDPINLTFQALGLFGLRVLFLSPDPNRKLLDLYDMFKNMSIEDRGFTPHLTLLIDEPAKIKAALDIVVTEISAPISGKVSRLSLYEFFPARHIVSIDLLK